MVVIFCILDMFHLPCQTYPFFIEFFTGVGYGWGLGSNLQLSTGDEEDEWTPIKLTGRNLEAKKVLALSAGGQHTALLVTAEESNSATT